MRFRSVPRVKVQQRLVSTFVRIAKLLLPVPWDKTSGYSAKLGANFGTFSVVCTPLFF